jgi:hypothetical protein
LVYWKRSQEDRLRIYSSKTRLDAMRAGAIAGGDEMNVVVEVVVAH